jgi:hypothetical protein
MEYSSQIWSKHIFQKHEVNVDKETYVTIFSTYLSAYAICKTLNRFMKFRVLKIMLKDVQFSILISVGPLLHMQLKSTFIDFCKILSLYRIFEYDTK